MSSIYALQNITNVFMNSEVEIEMKNKKNEEEEEEEEKRRGRRGEEEKGKD